jgi:hypothetical protein
LFKADPKVAPVERLMCPTLPTVQYDGFRAHELYIDAEVADLFSWGQIEPTQKFTEAIAIRDHVYVRPVDGCLFAMYGVCGGKKRQHWVLW